MGKRYIKAKAMTGLYKRKGSGKWYADLGRDTAGNRDRRTTGTSDQDKAIKQYKLWQIEKNLERILPSKFGAKQPYPFSLAVADYSDYLKRKNQRAYKNSGYYILKKLLDHFGDTPCHAITKLMVQKFMNMRLDDGLSTSTVRRDLSMLRAILNRAYDNEFTDRRPRIPHLASTSPRDRILCPDEEIRLLAVAPAYLREIIAFALETGGRKSEVLSLDWKNVDLKYMRIKFVKTKNGKDRVVPMTISCRDLLFSKQRKPSGPVFTFNDKQLKDIKTSFTTAKKKADIIDLTFHDLRHTFASRFIMRGGAQQPLMMILGHSTPAMTQRYTHLSQDYLASSIAVMNTQFNPNEEGNKLA